MSIKEEAIALRNMLDSGAEEEKMEHQLDKVLSGRTEEAVHELLFFRPYKEEADTLDEMWMILRAVESFPDAVYFRVLSHSLEEFCKFSPWFAFHLLAHISNGENDTNLLISNLSSSNIGDTQSILNVLASIDNGQRKPEQMQRLKRIRGAVESKLKSN